MTAMPHGIHSLSHTLSHTHLVSYCHDRTLKLALDALVDQAKPGRHPIHLACGLGSDCVEILLAMLHASKDYCHLFPEEEGSSLAKAAPGILDLNTPTEDADALTPLLIACQT